MARNKEHGLRRLTLVVDGVLLVVAVVAATYLHRLIRQLYPAVMQLADADQLVVLPLLIIPVFVFLISATGLDRLHERQWGIWELLWGLLKVHLMVLAIVAVLLFLTKTVVNRSLAVLFLACSFGLLLGARLLLRWWQGFSQRTAGKRQLLLIGAPGAALDDFVGQLGPEMVRGVLSARASASEPLPAGVQRLGAPDELASILHDQAVDEVFFLPPFNRPDDVVALLDVCETVGVPAAFAVELPRPTLARPRVTFEGDRPFISFELAPRHPEALALKQLFDVAVAFVLVVVTLPIQLLAAALVLFTMGRPIFFVQQRAGLFGRTFRMYKFRTMTRDAELGRDGLELLNEAGGPVFKMAADPRITPVGRLLRRLSVDELPQLFHVLSGTMSLIGPRPLPVAEQRKIQGWHRRRLSMKPGLTGLWQVSGRSDIGFEEWMRLDLRYVDEWSLWLDLKILLRTIPAVLTGRGAR